MLKIKQINKYYYITKISNSKNVKSSKSINTKNTVDEGKHLNPKVIYGIIGGGVLAIAFILFTSGTFDSAPVTNVPVNQNQQQNNVSSGVNLNNIQMINDLEAKIKQNPEDLSSLLELAHLKTIIHSYLLYTNIFVYATFHCLNQYIVFTGNSALSTFGSLIGESLSICLIFVFLPMKGMRILFASSCQR